MFVGRRRRWPSLEKGIKQSKQQQTFLIGKRKSPLMFQLSLTFYVFQICLKFNIRIQLEQNKKLVTFLNRLAVLACSSQFDQFPNLPLYGVQGNIEPDQKLGDHHQTNIKFKIHKACFKLKLIHSDIQAFLSVSQRQKPVVSSLFSHHLHQTAQGCLDMLAKQANVSLAFTYYSGKLLYL